MKIRLAIIGISFLASACGAAETSNVQPSTTTVTITVLPTTTASSVATTTTAIPSNELSPVPSNVNQLSGGGVPNQPAYGTRTSGEIQFEWGCMQGYIDASTCVAGGYGHVVPSAHDSDLPLNSEGLVDEGEITRRFWACMEQGGDEISCRQ